MYRHNIRAYSEEVIVIHSKKINAKYLKEYVWKSLFSKLAGLHTVTSIWINSFTDNFQRCWLNEQCPMAARFCTKSWKVPAKEVFLINVGWNLATWEWRNQSRGDALWKRCPEKFSKISQVNTRTTILKEDYATFAKFLRELFCMTSPSDFFWYDTGYFPFCESVRFAV